MHSLDVESAVVCIRLARNGEGQIDFDFNFKACLLLYCQWIIACPNPLVVRSSPSRP